MMHSVAKPSRPDPQEFDIRSKLLESEDESEVSKFVRDRRVPSTHVEAMAEQFDSVWLDLVMSGVILVG